MDKEVSKNLNKNKISTDIKDYSNLDKNQFESIIDNYLSKHITSKNNNVKEILIDKKISLIIKYIFDKELRDKKHRDFIIFYLYLYKIHTKILPDFFNLNEDYTNIILKTLFETIEFNKSKSNIIMHKNEKIKNSTLICIQGKINIICATNKKYLISKKDYINYLSNLFKLNENLLLESTIKANESLHGNWNLPKEINNVKFYLMDIFGKSEKLKINNFLNINKYLQSIEPQIIDKKDISIKEANIYTYKVLLTINKNEIFSENKIQYKNIDYFAIIDKNTYYIKYNNLVLNSIINNSKENFILNINKDFSTLFQIFKNTNIISYFNGNNINNIQEIKFNTNDFVFKKNTYHKYIYILKSGKVDLHIEKNLNKIEEQIGIIQNKKNKENKRNILYSYVSLINDFKETEKILEIKKPGEVISLNHIINEKEKYFCDARCDEISYVYKIKINFFNEMLEKSGDLKYYNNYINKKGEELLINLKQIKTKIIKSFISILQIKEIKTRRCKGTNYLSNNLELKIHNNLNNKIDNTKIKKEFYKMTKSNENLESKHKRIILEDDKRKTVLKEKKFKEICNKYFSTMKLYKHKAKDNVSDDLFDSHKSNWNANFFKFQNKYNYTEKNISNSKIQNSKSNLCISKIYKKEKNNNCINVINKYKKKNYNYFQKELGINNIKNTKIDLYNKLIAKKNNNNIKFYKPVNINLIISPKITFHLTDRNKEKKRLKSCKNSNGSANLLSKFNLDYKYVSII